MTWDTIKILVKKALDNLRFDNVIPTDAPKKTKHRSKTEIGFRWTEYYNDGRKRYHMFIGLRRVFNKMSEDERFAVTKPITHKKHK